jgi:hypothetical protein
MLPNREGLFNAHPVQIGINETGPNNLATCIINFKLYEELQPSGEWADCSADNFDICGYFYLEKKDGSLSRRQPHRLLPHHRLSRRRRKPRPIRRRPCGWSFTPSDPRPTARATRRSTRRRSAWGGWWAAAIRSSASGWRGRRTPGRWSSPVAQGS